MKQQSRNAGVDTLIAALLQDSSCRYRISVGAARSLIADASQVFRGERSLLEISPPVTVCGDIHGQFTDLLRIFQCNGRPPNQRYLFLGDYIDRGAMGLETLCLLLAMKVRYPGHVFLLRGNHETREMTGEYGFARECVSKTSKGVYEDFCSMFDLMPVSALIGGRILCVHGGLSPELSTLEQLREIARPADASCKSMLSDVLWSDPSRAADEWGPNERGDTVVWGKKPLHAFLERNNLSMLIRAHQMVMSGYEYPFEPDRSAVTIFSAPLYANEFNNRGAYLQIDSNLNVEPVQLPHEPKRTNSASRGQFNNNNRGKRNSYNRGGKKQRGRR